MRVVSGPIDVANSGVDSLMPSELLDFLQGAASLHVAGDGASPQPVGAKRLGASGLYARAPAQLGILPIESVCDQLHRGTVPFVHGLARRCGLLNVGRQPLDKSITAGIQLVVA